MIDVGDCRFTSTSLSICALMARPRRSYQGRPILRPSSQPNSMRRRLVKIKARQNVKLGWYFPIDVKKNKKR